ncbi:MAG: ribosome small subunit-dependent GTPase A [Candidatus Hydrogenedentes bacterium]|nr:ribosome small subunit-dependent GTPase A [Candidatus Hydrogenedentota bacterium]
MVGEVTGAFRHRNAQSEVYPAVGDWVAAEALPGEDRALIHAVLPRRTTFKRVAAGGSSEVQVVAANVDVVFLVNGLDHDFNIRRLERYLTLTWESGARPVVVLNKADICEDLEERMAEVDSAAMGAAVHVVSALSGAGMEALRPYLQRGATISFLGSSGVGKSSLINALAGEEIMATRAVRDDDSRGRHTTTHRQLVVLPAGGVLIDTPGMRELQLAAGEESLAAAFADVEQYAAACRFRDCTHENEPGCAVRAAMDTGALDAGRLQSFRKLHREIAYQERRQDQAFKHLEHQRARTQGKLIKRILREKGKQ